MRPNAAARRDWLASLARQLDADVGRVRADLRDWTRGYLEHHRERLVDQVDLLGEVDGPVLEIGCVPGLSTVLLARAGYDVRGVDLDPERSADLWRHHGLDVARVDIETEPLPFADGAFAAVVFAEILEHLRIDPLFTLEEMARVVRPGGRVLLATPNITPLHRLRFARGLPYAGDPLIEFRKLREIGHAGHLRLYSRSEVGDLLAAVGLQVERFVHAGPRVGMSGRERLVLRWLPRQDRFRESLYAIARKPPGSGGAPPSES